MEKSACKESAVSAQEMSAKEMDAVTAVRTEPVLELTVANVKKTLRNAETNALETSAAFVLEKNAKEMDAVIAAKMENVLVKNNAVNVKLLHLVLFFEITHHA